MASPALRTELGRVAEELVCDYLRAHGLSVLATNLRLGYLEIDIVARDGPVIAVVEVRHRGSSAWTRGLGSLDHRKRRRLRFAGQRLWNRWFKHDPSAERLRFDAASVKAGPRGPVIEYVRAAF